MKVFIKSDQYKYYTLLLTFAYLICNYFLKKPNSCLETLKVFNVSGQLYNKTWS